MSYEEIWEEWQKLQTENTKINFILFLKNNLAQGARRVFVPHTHALFLVTKYSHIFSRTPSPTPQLQAKRNKNTCPHKSVCKLVHSCTIHNNKKGNSPQIRQLVSGLKNFKGNLWCIHIVKQYSATKNEQLSIHTITWKNHTGLC